MVIHEKQSPCCDEEATALADVLAHIKETSAGRADELIPMLQQVQQKLGYLPEEALEEIARLTGVTPARVYGVATFYAQFRLEPVGKHVIKVCRGTACHVRGSGRILKDIEKRLGIIDGETTPDRQFTLETAACFGSCALAPVMVVNESVHGRMSSAACDGKLDELDSPPDDANADEPATQS